MKEYLHYIINFMSINKDWLFSGLGTNSIVAIITAIISYNCGTRKTRTIIKNYYKEFELDNNKYENLIVGASGATYRAPTNGFVYYKAKSDTQFYINDICVASNKEGEHSYKILKNQLFMIKYKEQIYELKFYYAKEVILKT